VDFGMVDRITAPLRQGLRRTFSAVVDRDSLGLVRALVDMGFIPLTRDIRPAVQLVERLLQKYRDLSPREIKAMDIEEIGNDIMASLQIGPAIQIPNEFILFGRSVGMLNGLSSRLDPDTNIIEVAAPFARRFIGGEAEGLAGIAVQARSAGRSIIRLPKLLSEFLVTTGRGETRVEITSKDVADELRKISRVGKGLILALLGAGCGLAAVLLRINGFPEESLWAGVASGVLLLWLALLLRRT
jgi:predicted unusual protein kinase regulating ubiquinone biosynthesis (AarF/ABC1/UbiB family)